MHTGGTCKLLSSMANRDHFWPGLLFAQFCWLLGGCGAAYPLAHYEAAYSKAALGTPDPDPAKLSQLSSADAARVAHGRYLVQITGCAACHTSGALIGEPSATGQLAGSNLGIAYTNPAQDLFPGVLYPPNLTPDAKTGLGSWTQAQIAGAIRRGTAPGSAAHLTVMPWPLYENLTDDDADAIAAYLRSIPAVEHQVPGRVPPGSRAPTSYVYFGVFRSGPAVQLR